MIEYLCGWEWGWKLAAFLVSWLLLGVLVGWTVGTAAKLGGPDDAAWVAMRQAMLLLIGHWDKNRSDTGDFPVHEIPAGAKMLIAPHKVWGV